MPGTDLISLRRYAQETTVPVLLDDNKAVQGSSQIIDYLDYKYPLPALMPENSKIGGTQHYLWRAVDQNGEIVDVYLQKRRGGGPAKRFFRRLLKAHSSEPRKIVTDKLRSYDVAHRELIPNTIHDTSQYANNRVELSHQPTRVRDRRSKHNNS